MKADRIRSIQFIAEPASGAVLMIEAVNSGEAKRYVDALPAVRVGLLEAEIIGLVPFHGYEVSFNA